MQKSDCAIIILAAGNSSRLGRPKQMLLYRGKTLLQSTVDAARAFSSGDMIVVTGAHADLVNTSIHATGIQIVYNNDWQQGLSASVKAGLSALLSQKPNTPSVMLLLCDQPFVSSGLLGEMMKEKHRSGKGIVACGYGDTTGVPAIFAATYFRELMALSGSAGARKIIADHADDLAVIPFRNGIIDIDTETDYSQLIG